MHEMASDENVKGLLVLGCDKNKFTPPIVDDVLKSVSVPLFGGIFPAIIHGFEKLERGTIIAGITKKPDVFMVPGLSDNSVDYEEVMEKHIPISGNGKTIFVFLMAIRKGSIPFLRTSTRFWGCNAII